MMPVEILLGKSIRKIERRNTKKDDKNIMLVGWDMMQERTELPFCRKCLTREMAGQEENFRSLWEIIENLDADIKTPASLYEERLSSCKACDMLLGGMCRSCGCYVELRAAVVKNYCPKEIW